MLYVLLKLHSAKKNDWHCSQQGPKDLMKHL